MTESAPQIPGDDDPRIPAAVVLLGAHGCRSTHSSMIEANPGGVLYVAWGMWPVPGPGPMVAECAAGKTFPEAIMRLCRQVVEAGPCESCSKPRKFLDGLQFARMSDAPLRLNDRCHRYFDGAAFVVECQTSPPPRPAPTKRTGR